MITMSNMITSILIAICKATNQCDPSPFSCWLARFQTTTRSNHVVGVFEVNR